MSLQYDPSALRYESTQQAYGQTWTLHRIEDDGAQLWRNGQGQEALVPRMAVEVAQQPLGKPNKYSKYDCSLDAINYRLAKSHLEVDFNGITLPLSVDFHQQNADKWGCSRAEAKNRWMFGGGLSQAYSLGPETETLKVSTTGDCTVEIDNKSTIEITGFAYQKPIKMHETVVDKQFTNINNTKVGDIATSTDGKRFYQWNGTDWNLMLSVSSDSAGTIRTISTEPNQSNGPKAGDQRVSADR